ncbi:hypothetical protein HGRIS_009086 [Hohenbuehelia grisea]|uniref:Uncharacterized protein n=1 Tax=Hohenbuehelia grisea TaxID=104357 RepID=A0ABR3J092_9AGAR
MPSSSSRRSSQASNSSSSSTFSSPSPSRLQAQAIDPQSAQLMNLVLNAGNQARESRRKSTTTENPYWSRAEQTRRPPKQPPLAYLFQPPALPQHRDSRHSHSHHAHSHHPHSPHPHSPHAMAPSVAHKQPSYSYPYSPGYAPGGRFVEHL